MGGEVFADAEIDVQHRIALPVLLQALHGQPSEKVFLSLEVGFERRHEQALAEATGTAEEIDLVGMRQSINQLRLVYIHTVVVAQLFKVLYPYRITPDVQFHICLSLIKH